MKAVTAAAMAVLGVSLCQGIAAEALNPQGAVNMGEWGLRQSATAAPMPEYPRESLAQKVSGVVVAAVLFGVHGKLTTIEILESPDAHTAAAVRGAVGRWIGARGVPVQGREEKSSAVQRQADVLLPGASTAKVHRPRSRPDARRGAEAEAPPKPSSPTSRAHRRSR
jgi:hypothetical protein